MNAAISAARGNTADAMLSLAATLPIGGQSFTFAKGFRGGLQSLTGQTGTGIEWANPVNGAWWEAQDHLTNAYAYNREWEKFIRINTGANASEPAMTLLCKKGGVSNECVRTDVESIRVVIVKSMRCDDDSFYYIDSGKRTPRRPAYGRLARKEDRPLLIRAHSGWAVPPAPIEIRLSRGTLYDVFWVEISPILSERAFHILSNNKISGWSTFPIRLLNSDRSDYHGLTITGRTDSLGFGEGCGEPYTNNLGQRRYKGIKFDRESWDGSDLFLSRVGATMVVLASEHFRNVIEANAIKGIGCTPISELDYSEISVHEMRARSMSEGQH